MPKCVASSFADPADVVAYDRAIAQGKSEQEAFKVGDNGLGFTGLKTAQLTIPMCALPPDDWQQISKDKHKVAGKRVAVTYKGKTITCVLGDTMPWKKNIKNGCGIDLNPAAVKALGLTPPIRVEVVWEWA